MALQSDPAGGEAAALRTAATVQLFVSLSMLLRLVLIVRAVYFARSDLVRPAGQFIRRFIELPGSPQLFMVKATFRERPIHSTLGVFAVVFFFVSYLLRLFETYTCAFFSRYPGLISERAQSAPAVPLGSIAGVVYFDSNDPSSVELLCAPLAFGDAAWLVLISSLTVGYGDVSAETHYGRAVSIVGTLLGILLTGVTIAAVIGFLRLSFPQQAVGQLLARSGAEKRFKHAAAITIQATWRHFYAEHSFLTWVSGAGGTIAVRPVSGRMPLEIAARRAVFDWRQLRRRARRENMNLNPILQRHISTQNLLVKVEDLRAEVEELLEEAGASDVMQGIQRLIQHQYDMDPARQLSAPMQVLSQAVALVGATAAAHKRSGSSDGGGGGSAGPTRGGLGSTSTSPQTLASDGGTVTSGHMSVPLRPAPMLGTIGKSVSGFKSGGSLGEGHAVQSPMRTNSTKSATAQARQQLLRQLSEMSTQVSQLQSAAKALDTNERGGGRVGPANSPSSPQGFSVFTFTSPKTTDGGDSKRTAGQPTAETLSPPIARGPEAARLALHTGTAAGDSKSVPKTGLGGPAAPPTSAQHKLPAARPAAPPKRQPPAAPKRRPGPPSGVASSQADTPRSKGGWVTKKRGL